MKLLLVVSSSRNRGDRRRLGVELRDSEARYRLLADAISDHVWTTDAGGALDHVNARAVAYFGGSAEDIVRAGWLALVHLDDMSRCTERWTASLATSEPFELELRLRAVDGRYRTHVVRALPFRGSSGQISKWIGTSSDVSVRRQLEGERERLIHELDQFAYVSSHDLKAPLRGIANLSQWIEEDLGDRMTETSREQMTLLRGRVRRLDALIDGILSYSRAGRGHEVAERVDVGRLVQDSLGMLLPAHPGTTALVGDGMPVLRTSKDLLQQVFLNLIGNGITHAQRTDPHVQISVCDRGSYLDFSVADNGPGIAPEFHARIWEIFQTLAARDRVEGTGVGLSVVRKIVEARGGKAWVDSRLGEGATFHFLWPAVEAAS